MAIVSMATVSMAEYWLLREGALIASRDAHAIVSIAVVGMAVVSIAIVSIAEYWLLREGAHIASMAIVSMAIVSMGLVSIAQYWLRTFCCAKARIQQVDP